MKNLFLKFISESSNFNQERISFINSVRKNSNLRPFSLINEAPAPAPQIAPNPNGDKPFDDFNRFNDETFGRFSDNFTTFNPNTTPDGFMIFDNLMRDLLGSWYSSISPSMLANLFNIWGGDLDALRALINSNVTLTSSNGTQFTPSQFVQIYLSDFTALQWISANITDLNNQTAINQALQTLLNNNPSMHANVVNLLNLIRQNGLQYVQALITSYQDIVGMFQANGVIFPNLSQINNLWTTYFTDLVFNSNPLLNLSSVDTPDLNGLLSEDPNLNRLIDAIQEYINSGGNASLFNMANLQNIGSPLGLTQIQIAQLLMDMYRLQQNDPTQFYHLMDALINSNGDPQALGELFNTITSTAAPSSSFGNIMQTIIGILKRLRRP